MEAASNGFKSSRTEGGCVVMPHYDSELRTLLEQVPDKVETKFCWDEEKDRLLLEFWPKKRKVDVARILGCHRGTARDRYAYLIEKEAREARYAAKFN